MIDDAEPLRVRIKPDKLKASDVLIDQIRAIDNRRLIKGPVVHLSSSTMTRIETALREGLGLA